MRDPRAAFLGMSLAATCLAPLLAEPPAAWGQVVKRVSVASDGGQGNGFSFTAALSADGRFVAFESLATNLVPGDTNGRIDVFVHDRLTAQTARVSVASGGAQAAGNSFGAALSADGRFVAFESNAMNLIPGDTNGQHDIFVHDRLTGQTTRVSVASGGAQATGGGSFAPALSADGRFVTFESDAANLVPNDTNGQTDVFVHDRLTAATSRVSLGPGGAQATGGDSFSRALSADGRFVAFESRATNLVPNDTNGQTDVFVHDRLTAVTSRVSVGPGGAQGNGFSFNTALSADGRFVAFQSKATNLVPSDTNGLIDVFVHDRLTGTTARVSVASDGTQATGVNTPDPHPRISADGRVVAFNSNSTNLVPGDTNGFADVFLARLAAGPNWLLTGPGPGGGPHARGFDATGAGTLLSLFPYPVGFPGGVRVGTGDVNGDGAADLLTGAGPGGGPHVRVLGGTTAATELASFFAYPAGFTGGVFVAAGDVDGDGVDEIITGAGAGGGPHVRALHRNPDGSLSELASFFAFPVGFTGGGRVAAGDIDGDGRADLLVGAGPGGGPHVRVLTRNPDGSLSELASFFAFPAGFTGGVFVAAGDVNGDGRADLLVGAGPGGGPHVRVLTRNPDGTLSELASFFAYPAGFTGGVTVAAGDVNGDGRANIITGAGPGGGPHVRVLTRNPDGTLTDLASFFAYDPAFTGGVFVAGFR